MGTAERAARRRRRLGTFQVCLLAAVAVGAVVLVAATMPNVAQLLRYFPGYKRRGRFTHQAKSALSRLTAEGFITWTEKNGKRYAHLTAEGSAKLALETVKTRVQKKRRWDRRWRIVMFDIPERRKSIRDALRRFMSDCGFVRLQDSVWIYPYDCEDLIALAKTEFKIGADALYIIAEHVEYDRHLREHFELPMK